MGTEGVERDETGGEVCTKKKIFVWIVWSIFLITAACSSSESLSSEKTHASLPTDTNIPASVPTNTPTNTNIPTDTPPPPPTATPTPFPPFRDDFTYVLGEGWEWIKESGSGWNLEEKPGFLRVEVVAGAEQILLRQAPQGNFEIMTRVLFTPDSNFQSAGLIIYQDDGHLLSFHRGMCDYVDIVPEKCQGNAIYFNHIDHDVGVPEEGYSIGPQFPTRTENQSEAYLRLAREGILYSAYYSDDGENWTIIGNHETDLKPNYVGIQTFGAQQNNAFAEFDYFTLETLP